MYRNCNWFNAKNIKQTSNKTENIRTTKLGLGRFLTVKILHKESNYRDCKVVK